MKTYFEKQSRLLLETLKTVRKQPLFSLKGGTAINFFHSNFPRLSVDIDLAYTKVDSRSEFLSANEKLYEFLYSTLSTFPGYQLQIQRTKEGIPKQMNVFSNDTMIKIEGNLILRGTVYPCVLKNSCEKIKQIFDTELSINTLSFEDLYAGKFCAALDRQHPRDLFDVLEFFKNNIITDKLKIAFLIYLISGSRPISELLHPNRLDQRRAFENEFLGMTDVAVAYSSLEEARESLINRIDDALTSADREFLLSFKAGNPNWEHINILHLKDMPAIKWKLLNIQKMKKNKHQKALGELKRKLNM